MTVEEGENLNSLTSQTNEHPQKQKVMPNNMFHSCKLQWGKVVLHKGLLCARNFKKGILMLNVLVTHIPYGQRRRIL